MHQTQSLIKQFWLFCIISCCPLLVNAESLINRESQLKAIYLFHFAELTRWPERHQLDKHFRICLLGETPLSPYLDELREESVNQQTVLIVPIKRLENTQHCRIIYIEDNELFHEPDLDALSETLVVGTQPAFIEKGGSISFNVQNNKIKLLVNLSKIRQSNLDISSKLLRIADVIE